MITITEHQCEICNLRYDIMEDCLECETRGPGKEYPIGCIYGNHADASMYEQITFAVATNRIEGHFNRGASWACRDTGAGDSIGQNMCSGPSLHLRESDAYINPDTQHFKRMVLYLKNNMIDITFWDGKRPISYATFWDRFFKGKLHFSEKY